MQHRARESGKELVIILLSQTHFNVMVSISQASSLRGYYRIFWYSTKRLVYCQNMVFEVQCPLSEVQCPFAVSLEYIQTSNSAVFQPYTKLLVSQTNVVCCVGRVEIQIEIWKGWYTQPIRIIKSNVSSVGPSSERMYFNLTICVATLTYTPHITFIDISTRRIFKWFNCLNHLDIQLNQLPG